jgi:hypothetical protein
MKVQIVTPYRVSHLQRCGVTERVNVTSVYPPLAVTIYRCPRVLNSITSSRLTGLSISYSLSVSLFLYHSPTLSIPQVATQMRYNRLSTQN